MMVQVSRNMFVNANEINVIKLTSQKKVYILLKNNAEIDTKAETEEETEKLFWSLVSEIDSLQRQAGR